MCVYLCLANNFLLRLRWPRGVFGPPVSAASMVQITNNRLINCVAKKLSRSELINYQAGDNLSLPTGIIVLIYGTWTVTGQSCNKLKLRYGGALGACGGLNLLLLACLPVLGRVTYEAYIQ